MSSEIIYPWISLNGCSLTPMQNFLDVKIQVQFRSEGWTDKLYENAEMKSFRFIHHCLFEMLICIQIRTYALARTLYIAYSGVIVLQW